MKHTKMPITPHQQTGVTLIELVISLVIISIALTGIFSVINLTVSHSADPVVDYQAIAVAESYLEEILLHAYSDPNNTNANETRASYDDVNDYNGLNNLGASNSQGDLLVNLSSYNVSVTVVTANPDLSGVPAKVITVTVTEPRLSAPLILIGYKFDY